MKYLIIGAGGTGASIGGFLANNGKDVTFIARGKHLEAIKSKGLVVLSPKGKMYIDANAMEMDKYNDKPDVIFICVKWYSLDEIIPFIIRVADEDTIIIPILNTFGTGEKLADDLPKNFKIMGGFMYLAADILSPGEIIQRGEIFKISFGPRGNGEYLPILDEIAKDLIESGIDASTTMDITRDKFQKFSFVSPMAATGIYFDANAGDMQREGIERDTFIELIKEIDKLAIAMDIGFNIDIVKRNLEILDDLLPNVTSSMQKDIKRGSQSEIDGLIYDVVRLGKKHNVKVPMYTKITNELKERFKKEVAF